MAIWDIFKKRKEPPVGIGGPLTHDQLGLPELQDPAVPPPGEQPAPFGEEPQMPAKPPAFGEPSLSPMRNFQPGAQPPPQQPGMQHRDVEVILSKLDAIKAILQSLETRVAALERIAQGEQQQPRSRW